MRINQILILGFAIILSSCGKKELKSDNSSIANNNIYNQFQIGSEWDKISVPLNSVNVYSPSLQRMFKGTGRVSVSNPYIYKSNNKIGTAFYVGKYSYNEYIFATAAHVFEGASNCNKPYSASIKIDFPVLQETLNCHRIIDTISDIDLAIFTVVITSSVKKEVFNNLKPFSLYNKTNQKNKTFKISTAGFGSNNNPDLELSYNPRTCNNYPNFGTSKLSFINQTTGKRRNVWSQVTDCDISAGDSGSMAMDQNTGELIGMFWASSNRKPIEMRDQEYINQILGNNKDTINDNRLYGKNIWKDFSYIVPLSEISRVLQNYVNQYKKKGNRSSLLKSRVIAKMLNNMKNL